MRMSLQLGKAHEIAERAKQAEEVMLSARTRARPHCLYVPVPGLHLDPHALPYLLPLQLPTLQPRPPADPQCLPLKMPSLPVRPLCFIHWDSVSICPLGCVYMSGHTFRTCSWNTLEDASIGGTG